MTLRALRAANARARDGKLRSPEAQLRTVAKGDSTEIFLYGALFPDPIFDGEISAEDFITALGAVSTPKVTVRINSPGGVVTEGMAIYNVLASRGGSVTTQVDGLAASCAADILLASADRRALGRGAFVMTHKAWGWALGCDEECLSVAAVLTKMDSTRRGIYVEALQVTDAKAATDYIVRDDKWFTAEEALAAGLVKAVGDDQAVEANARMFNLSAYAHAPEALTRETRFALKPADDLSAETIAAATRASQAARMRMAEALI